MFTLRQGVIGPVALGLFVGLAVPARSAEPSVKQAYGTIKGRLVWGGREVPVRPPLIKKGDSKTKDPAICAVDDLPDRTLVVNASNKGIASAIAYLPKPVGKNEAAVKEMVAAAPEVVLDQKNCEFLPHVLAFHQDQKVVFKSSDPVLHNVRYTGFTNTAQNLALPPNGKFETKLKAETRPMELKCDVHPWMNGWLKIFDHPFFAVTDGEGTFEIKGVPAGTQQLIVWHENPGYVTEGKAKGIPITVKAGEVTTVPDIVLKPSQVKDSAAPKAAGN